MEVAERISRLKSLDLFEHLAEEDLHRFLAEVGERQLAPGEVLFEDGDPGESMYVLLKGMLEVKKDFRIITWLEPVDYVGEMALVEEKPRSATVIAVKPSLLLRVDRDVFARYLAVDSGLLLSITRSLSRKIRNDTEIISQDCERANILLHDIKNQLTPFLYLDLVAQSVPEEGPSRKYLQIMQECWRRLSAMTEEAMAVVKRENRPYFLRPASLPGLIKDLVENELADHPDLKERTLEYRILSEMKEFPFHENDIRRVLTNLILNSAQASPPGGTIVVEVEEVAGMAQVRVRDHGMGVPPELHDLIFAAHFTTKESGNGLGLASCRQIVEERHGGSLDFISTPGQETVFTFTLAMK